MGMLLDSLSALLRGRANQPAALWFFAGIFVVSQLSILAVLEPVGPALVLKLQTTFSADTFAAICADLYARGLAEHYLAHYYYDFLHPVWYATLLALLLGQAFNRNDVAAARNRWLLLPFVAGLLDLAENGLHLYMVIDTANIAAPLVALSATAAVGKWVLVAVCSLAIAGLWLRSLVAPRGRP